MSGTPDAVVQTTTTVNSSAADDHDGVIPEPGRTFANVLWLLVVVTLCVCLVGVTAALVLLAFTPKDPPGSVDSAVLVAVQGAILAALLGFYVARQRR